MSEWTRLEKEPPKYQLLENGDLVSSKILFYREKEKTMHLGYSMKFYIERKGEFATPVYRFYDEWGDEWENVTHWMPRPEPPKEG